MPAQTVVIHAEAYYKWVKQSLAVRVDETELKSHIFIFNDREIWNEFVLTTPEKLPGGEAFTNGVELFMYRDPFWMEAPRVLAHEITHLAAARFVKGKLPLFLSEGFAEFMATRAVAMKTDGDTFQVKNFQPIPESDYIPLKKIAAFENYPENIEVFYRQSEYLIRYLMQRGDGKLFDFLKKSASGKSLDSILGEVYGLSVESLDEKLKIYCATR